MFPELFAIYIVVSLAAENSIHWFEFQAHQPNMATNDLERPKLVSWHFATQAVCELYRQKLVAAWVADPAVPFRAENVVSSRCGLWAPDPSFGLDL